MEDFKLLLEKAINNKLNEEDLEEFLCDYIYEGDFKYLQIAAHSGFNEAWYHLGIALFNGDGCEKSISKALDCWQLSATLNMFGAVEIADCYRLGLHVEQNYNLAWEWYKIAYDARLERGEHPELRELLLEKKEDYEYLYNENVNPQWWIFAATKVDVDSRFLYSLAGVFEYESEDYFFWHRKAAEAGHIDAKCIILTITTDQNEKNKLIMEIINSSYISEIIEYELFKILDEESVDEELKIKIFNYLHKYDCDIREHFKGRDEELEYYLEFSDKYEDDDDDWDCFKSEPEGYFECSCCGRLCDLDDQNNPDMQGELCNDCYYSGYCNIER